MTTASGTDDEEFYDKDDGEDDMDQRPPGVIQFQTQTLLLWLVVILLVLVIIDTVILADFWFTLQRFRDALSHLLPPTTTTGQ